MKSTIEYKNYFGSIKFSEKDELFYGRVLGIKSLLTFEGRNVHELLEDFHGVIDDYLEICKENSVEPEKSFRGSFNIRVSPVLYKETDYLCARKEHEPQ